MVIFHSYVSYVIIQIATFRWHRQRKATCDLRQDLLRSHSRRLCATGSRGSRGARGGRVPGVAMVGVFLWVPSGNLT